MDKEKKETVNIDTTETPETSKAPGEAQKALQENTNTDGGAPSSQFALGCITGVFGALFFLLLLALADDPDTDFEQRLQKCEAACGLTTAAPGKTEPKQEKTAGKATPEVAPEKKSPSSAKPEEEAPSSAKPEEKPPSSTRPKTSSSAKPTPEATLSPEQLKYFCSVLIINTKGSKNPKKWKSPEKCAEDDWYLSDVREYYDEWLQVAAHPKTTSELLHYLAYRCRSEYIYYVDDAVELAKLILANKNCDDVCIGYFCESDIEEVRELVYNRILENS